MELLLVVSNNILVIPLWLAAGLFISLTEVLDFNTITGTAMAGLLTVFDKFERDILRERVKAGIAHARKQGKPHEIRDKNVSTKL